MELDHSECDPALRRLGLCARHRTTKYCVHLALGLTVRHCHVEARNAAHAADVAARASGRSLDAYDRAHASTQHSDAMPVPVGVES